MLIRRYQSADAADVARICNAATKAYIWDDLNELQRSIALLTPQSAAAIMITKCAIVLELHSNIIAMCAMNPKTGYIDFLYVDPEHIRNGYGRMLLHDIEKKAKELGLSQLSLHSSSYASKNAFYEKCGFTNNGPHDFKIAGVPFRGDKMIKNI